MSLKLIAALAGVLAMSAPSYGHHSFAAYYFEDQTISITGEVVRFDYRAPHAWVYVVAPDASGDVRTFGAEWSNPRRLERDGIRQDTLRPGDYVVIAGSPGRTPSEHRIHLKAIERPADGWSWSSRRR